MTEQRAEAARDWHVMLSYRHRKHKAAVNALARFLDAVGLRYWLDTQRIDQTAQLPEQELKTILREAAERSQIVLGFPAEDALELDAITGASRVTFSWLFWERQFAREVLWVEDGRWLCAFPDQRLRVFFVPYLAYLLGLACGLAAQVVPFWSTHFGEMPPATQSAYGVQPIHTLPVELWPSLVVPAKPSARRNAVLRSSIRDRADLATDHRMEILE